MAQTARQHVEHEAAELTADQAAWNKAAVARKYGVHNAMVWGGVNGALFPIPALPGFASLPESHQPLVFQAVAQFAIYRIAQNVDGEAITGAVHKFVSGGSMPNAKDNDAWESIYTDKIGDLIAAKIGKVDTKDSEAVKTRRAQVDATATAKRGDLFHQVVQSAIDSGTRALPARERKRATSAPKADMVVSLD